MDANRFDALARAVGTSPDRRGLLKAAAGGALGLVGLSALTDGAVAKKKECDKNNDCNNNKKCHKNKCVECVKNKNCKADEKCHKHKCEKK